MGIAFFWFFSVTHKIVSATSHQKLSYPNAMAHLSSPKIKAANTLRPQIKN
jgi:hypothetical protein